MGIRPSFEGWAIMAMEGGGGGGVGAWRRRRHLGKKTQ